MALVDWEIIRGGGLQLSSEYKVSGAKSLTQSFNGGETHIVHSATYGDAPKNVRIDTWMTLKIDSNGWIGYFIGGIARKKSGENTYFYWCVELEFAFDSTMSGATATWGYYINGTQTQVGSEDIKDSFISSFGSRWSSGKWRFVRIEGYESGGKFNISIAMTPDIDTPDPNNPPVDQLKPVFSKSIDIPTELNEGGACGLVVGGVNESGGSNGVPFYDYTQIYY